jgi:hypothetical protein
MAARISGGACRSAEDARPVSESVLDELPFIRLKQRPDIGRQMRECIRLDLLQSQLRYDVRNRAVKPGPARKVCITAQSTNLR